MEGNGHEARIRNLEREIEHSRMLRHEQANSLTALLGKQERTDERVNGFGDDIRELRLTLKEFIDEARREREQRQEKEREDEKSARKRVIGYIAGTAALFVSCSGLIVAILQSGGS